MVLLKCHTSLSFLSVAFSASHFVLVQTVNMTAITASKRLRLERFPLYFVLLGVIVLVVRLFLLQFEINFWFIPTHWAHFRTSDLTKVRLCRRSDTFFRGINGNNLTVLHLRLVII